MSAYKELVKRCVGIIQVWLDREDDGATDTSDYLARELLAEVYHTLETVTAEMHEAWDKAPLVTSNQMAARVCWLAMLRAAPLGSPKDKP